MKKILAILFLLSAYFVSVAAGDSLTNAKSHEYSIELYTGGGLSVYSGTSGVSQIVQTKLNKTGISGTIRLMWHPDHRLRVGFESGRIPFYSYKIYDSEYSGSMSVTSTPLLIVWSMALSNRINVFAGWGLYILNSKLDYAGVTASSSNSLGYMLAANYVFPVSEDLGIGTEIKWIDANETHNRVLNFQLQLIWKFIRW